MKPSLLRIALVALILAVQLATVVIVVLGMRNQTERQFSGQASQSLARLGEQVQQRLTAATVPAARIIDGARELVGGGVLDAASSKTVENYFLTQLRAHAELESLRLARENGTLVQVSRDERGYLSRVISIAQVQPNQAAPTSITPRALVTFRRLSARSVTLTRFDPQLRELRSWIDPKALSDPRQAGWYQLARRSSQTVWTEPTNEQVSADTGLVVASATRFPNSTDAGVIAADVSMARLTAAVAGIELPDAASLAIIDEDGMALAYMAQARQLVAGDPVPAESLIGQPLRALLGAKSISLIAEAPAAEQWERGQGFAQFDVDGVSHVGRIIPLEVTGNGSLPWLLSIQAPESSFTGALSELFSRKMRTLLAVILIPALIALLALFGMTSEPVRRETEDSVTDEATGFMRRDEFRRRLDGMLLNRRELEYGGRIVVVALQIDGYDNLLLRYGKETGELVIRQFARRLRGRVRQHDLLGRADTDNFLIALRVDHDADVLTTVNRIRRATVVKPFNTRTGRHLLGVTAGIACVDPNEGVDDLLSRADQALVTGKARSANRSYLAPERDSQWPQTGIALPDESSDAQTPEHEESPTLVI